VTVIDLSLVLRASVVARLADIKTGLHIARIVANEFQAFADDAHSRVAALEAEIDRLETQLAQIDGGAA
jgi:hypothetical protein